MFVVRVTNPVPGLSYSFVTGTPGAPIAVTTGLDDSDADLKTMSDTVVDDPANQDDLV